MSASPAVSVITPVWNARATLAEAVGSVLAQTMPDWELLLVDDGSTDGSRDLAERVAARDGRVRVLGDGVNRGPAAARNAGIRAARGRRLAFLDADDRWRPEKLEAQLRFMEETGHAFVFSSYRRMDADGRPRGVVRAAARLTHADLLRSNDIGCLTAIYDSHALGKVEMPDIRRRQDYGLWLKLLRGVPAAYGMPEVLADYRVGAGSLSSNKLVAAGATWRLYRDVEGLSRLEASRCFAQYVVRAGAKRARAALG